MYKSMYLALFNQGTSEGDPGCRKNSLRASQRRNPRPLHQNSGWNVTTTSYATHNRVYHVSSRYWWDCQLPPRGRLGKESKVLGQREHVICPRPKGLEHPATPLFSSYSPIPPALQPRTIIRLQVTLPIIQLWPSLSGPVLDKTQRRRFCPSGWRSQEPDKQA